LPIPRALQVHGDRARENEVELRHLLEVDHAPVPHGALDRGRLAQRVLVELARIEEPERVLVAQPRHCHHEALALLEREPSRVGLGRVRVRLDRLRPHPRRVLGQPVGGRLGACEVRDPALSAGEARHALPVHGPPDVFPNFVLRAHRHPI
jgi:hypothetical protein